jgi:CheY-like chemotaxis protein
VVINGAAAGKVLIVDDERLNVDVLSRVLARDGYEVISAPNGVLASDAVGREHPDVVLRDVNMPGLCGLEPCRQISDP